MTTVTHATHAMSHTAHPTHSMRAMKSRMGGSKARTVINTSCCSHSTTVASADVSSAFPMNATALTVDSLRVLRMRRCLA
jgi:hypothetical protein